MAKKNSQGSKGLKEISQKMRKLDLCMMTTIKGKGVAASRPMSNNADVEYDGNSYFFSDDQAGVVKDLTANPATNLSFSGPKKLFISLEGRAKLVRNRALMESHWQKELEKWFEEGLDTPGLVMIHVKAKRIKYWQGEDEGEVIL